jgi:hypothetical protein
MVRGFESLPPAPEGTPYFLGWFDESRLNNSAVDDLNLNGSTNDRFAIITVETKNGMVAYIDVDGDDDVSDAKPIQSYDVQQQTFTFPRRSPDNTRPPLTFAIHIDESGTLVSMHFDDGGHGTHVAGIAAGYRLGGRTDYHGIAPGAQVLSLKIGDNTLSGGATTSDSMREAIEFAGQWSEDHKQLVIMNISYGIGSEIEGESDIDVVLDEALVKYPLLHASVSAGNEGPGLSSVGTPAAAQFCTAVAALLPIESAEALYGARLAQDRIFAFSSRGGELEKPDVLAPGTASSSVANHDTRDVKAGTSMAAPQISGVYALLASAAAAKSTRVNGNVLKRALLHSARPIRQYSPLAQGAGIPDVERAFQALKALAKANEPFSVAGYSIRTTVPTSHSGNARAAYWRTGTYIPPETTGHKFTIEAVHRENTTAEQHALVQNILNLESDSDWLSVDRRTARLQGQKDASIRVFYDHNKLRTPGIYTGRVHVTPENGAGIAAVSLWNTVVVPWVFEHRDGYARDWKGESLTSGQIRRYPILVPPGATAMHISAHSSERKYGNTRLFVLDPTGQAIAMQSRVTSSERGSIALATVTGEKLTPGVWEIVTYASFRNRKTSRYDLKVRFRSLNAPHIRHWETQAGRAPSGTFYVTNLYDTRFSGSVTGALFGYRREKTYSADTDRLSISVPMNEEIERVDFELTLAPKTYNRFTDIAIAVEDEQGINVVESGFNNGTARITVHNPGGSHELNLKIQGALTRGEDDTPWQLHARETWVRKRQANVEIGDTTLYPQVRESLTFQLSETPPAAPAGYSNYGEIIFREGSSGEVWLTLPMMIQ